jgi:hypothetical protein
MSFRNTILENVRNNQPSSRELPAIPKFHSEQPVDLKKQFTAALKELYGEVVTEPPADLKAFLKERFPSAKAICSTVPEYTGNSKPEDFARWSDAGSIDVTIVRSPLGVAETGSVLFSEEEFRVNTIGFFGARHCDPARSRRNCREHTRRLLSPAFPGQSIQLADVRTFRLGRYWRNHCPSCSGSNDAYRYILAARADRNYANRLDVASTVAFSSPRWRERMTAREFPVLDSGTSQRSTTVPP